MSKYEMAFTGFFMAEGMIRISKDMKRSGRASQGDKYPWYRQVARITLRDDDERVLNWIQKKFGGHIFKRGVRYNITNKQTGKKTFSNPVTIWQAEDMPTIEKICRAILRNPMPSKKKEEAKVFLEYAKLKKRHYKRGKKYPQEVLDKFELYHLKMKELKKYKST